MSARPNLGPSVAKGALLRTSVSAMQKFDACERQWYMKYSLGLPDKPDGKGVVRGTEGHGRIEDYLRTGADRLDRLERLALPYMPPPRHPEVLVEHPVLGELDAAGTPLAGYIDLVDLSGTVDSYPRVVDWKFRSDVAKYGAKAEHLASADHPAGIQMLGYGEWFRRKYGLHLPSLVLQLEHVEMQWVGRAFAKRVVAAVPLDEIAEKWEIVSRRIIPPMRAAAGAKRWQDVRPNFKACDSFGGCPYRNICLDPAARLRAYFSSAEKEVTPDMPLPSFLTGTKPASPAAPGPAILDTIRAAKAAPKVVDVPPGHVLASEAEAGAQYYVQGKWTVFTCNTDGQASFAPSEGGAPILTSLDTPVYPDPNAAPKAAAPPPPAPARASAPPLVQPPDAPAPSQAAPPTPPTPAPVAVLRLPGAPAAPPAAPAKRGPGRPPKVQAQAEPQATAPVPSARGVRLYFTGSPVGVPTKFLLEYTLRLEATLLEQVRQSVPADAPEQQVVDLRLSQGQVLGYGQWAHWLSNAARENPPEAGHYLVTPGDARVDAVAAALSGILEPGSVVR